MTKWEEGFDRRSFLAMVAGGAVTLKSQLAFGKIDERPNVLIIQPDQHCGMVMSCAGDKQISTPNLDRLAAEGAYFRRCASSSPVCSPFRGSVQTGLYPHKHDVLNNGIRLNPKLICIADVFGEAGYATGYIGKWHLDGGRPKPEGGKGITNMAVGGYVPPERRRGWQEWNGYEKSHEFFEVWKYNEQQQKVRVDGYDWEPTWHTDMALDFARRNRDANKPWLYYLAYGPPHKPEECTENFLNMFDRDKFVLPPDIAGKLTPDQEAAVREAWHVYYAQVAAIDHEIGRLVKGLKDLGIDDNTIILYTSDHGDRLGSHWIGKSKEPKKSDIRGKGAPYAKAFRIPLIVRWPAKIKPEQMYDALVSSVDLVPTLLDLADMPPIEGMQGDSMAGWCLKGEGPDNKALWIGLRDWRAVWDGRHIYARGKSYNHLFDHDADPHEMKNLLDSPKHEHIRKRMHKLLIDLAKKVEDPMLPQLRKL